MLFVRLHLLMMILHLLKRQPQEMIILLCYLLFNLFLSPLKMLQKSECYSRPDCKLMINPGGNIVSVPCGIQGPFKIKKKKSTSHPVSQRKVQKMFEKMFV